jgi:hypothetical protein
MSSLSCRQCGQPITFDNKHISQITGKKIPLDVATNEPHDCPVRSTATTATRTAITTKTIPPMYQRLWPGNLF